MDFIKGKKLRCRSEINKFSLYSANPNSIEINQKTVKMFIHIEVTCSKCLITKTLSHLATSKLQQIVFKLFGCLHRLDCFERNSWRP